MDIEKFVRQWQAYIDINRIYRHQLCVMNGMKTQLILFNNITITVWVKKVAPLNFFAIFLPQWWTCVTENYLGYCLNIFLHLHQPWSIYLIICMKCITFTSNLTIVQFSVLRISWIFRWKTSHIKLYLNKYNSSHFFKWIIPLNVQNTHRWLMHMPAVACGCLSQRCKWRKADQINWSVFLNSGTVFAFVAACVKTPALFTNLIIYH